MLPYIKASLNRFGSDVASCTLKKNKIKNESGCIPLSVRTHYVGKHRGRSTYILQLCCCAHAENISKMRHVVAPPHTSTPLRLPACP